MRIYLIILFFISLMNVLKTQTKLCYDVYYYKNPNHELKSYKNILVFTNASPRTKKALKKAAENNNYKITISTELFPPIKDYTDREIAQEIRKNQIDAILYYTIEGSEVVATSTYGTYRMPSSIGLGSFSSSQHDTYYTTIKAALVEPDRKDEKIFYCTGGAKGNSFDVGYRVFKKMLMRFEKIGIAMPLNNLTPNKVDDEIQNDEKQKIDEVLAYEEEANKNFESEDFLQAIENFDKVIELDPENINAYFNRGRAKSAIGNQKESISDYNKVLELDPEFSMAYNNRGWSNFLLKNYIEALIDFNKAIELDPKNYVAYDSRQETKFALNDFVGCLEDCNIAISINPKLANSYYFKGKVLFKNGDKSGACESWSKAGQFGKMDAYDLIKVNCN